MVGHSGCVQLFKTVSYVRGLYVLFIVESGSVTGINKQQVDFTSKQGKPL